MDLSEFRQEYTGRGLHREDLEADPIRQFEAWFQQAIELGLHEPNAMSLATVDASGQPLLRTVLLKGFDTRGFVFYTNYESRKARHMAENPQVSLLFPWIALERQVIVQGRVEKCTAEETANYFHSRPRESQLGAWVSHQSEVIDSRQVLTEKLAELTARFGGGEIPVPPFWGGYRVVPQTIEFWQGGPARLHDRFLYQRQAESWSIDRLSP
ncbi:pyridoxamine 5'-phosphate oxidase [Haloferula sp. BvORR071]|uniref:pyridoxamine 5'-phosphate oxidase n=1 Tax=Haloferula sp. BvORR071 TaxID=1396141 RepID=UPI00054F756C|nr:pyridoxamine 5'-phosphate oxidase [Haloferula sp. BvORR071]